eukprot:CAMPEP_0113694712 /NCGR_PEP_ID=MMETSP0038_2-20120614/20462_1 /TAXON_ID=2898 /ORGANISM="Cryptomonas paramecium" /LENGTH=172 /DNA_ID=CAMNT_0000617105 /DNA_START=1 /DNA_END=516 /DNA_ORIENTATION=+ /assembly_acc=CAM_ASM_000170
MWFLNFSYQAQLSIMQQSDEFVVEAFMDFEKVQVLIVNLVIIELWKEKVLPSVLDLADSHYVKLYLATYHEVVLAGLLEKTFFNSSSSSSAGDALVELADFCHRKLVYLASIDHDDIPGVREQPAEAILASTDQDRLLENASSITFASAMSGLTLARFLTDQASSLPPAVIS